MNRIQNFEIILDADDVLLDCNNYALQLLSQQDGCAYDLDRVTGWGKLGIPEDRRLDLLEEASFYENQPALPGAQEFLTELMKVARVTIMTAVYPRFMGERIRRLAQLFPDLPMENIIMGSRKEMIQADVMLDDGVHNLLTSGAKLPVLFRRPWNRSVSGICSINYYDEFLSLIGIMTGTKQEIDRVPKILCIVGPSGSGKHKFARALCEDSQFTRIRTCTTSEASSDNRHVSEEEFNAFSRDNYFLEVTYYCQDRYGLPRKDIEDTLNAGRNAVAVMDISGCMAVHNSFPGQSLILYVDTDKRECFDRILRKEGLRRDQAVDRLLSYDFEEKNKILADRIIRADADGSFRGACEEVKGLL